MLNTLLIILVSICIAFVLGRILTVFAALSRHHMEVTTRPEYVRYREKNKAKQRESKRGYIKRVLGSMDKKEESKAAVVMTLRGFMFACIAVGGYSIGIIFTAPTIFGYMLLSPIVWGTLQLLVFVVMQVYIVHSVIKRWFNHLEAERDTRLALNRIKK